MAAVMPAVVAAVPTGLIYHLTSWAALSITVPLTGTTKGECGIVGA
jgi:hypothetical protein